MVGVILIFEDFSLPLRTTVRVKLAVASDFRTSSVLMFTSQEINLSIF